MSTIGAYPFFAIHGGPPDLWEMKTAPITRPGVDGKAIWLMGLHGDPFTLTTFSACTSAATIGTAIVAYKALTNVGVAGLQAITDDFGNTYSYFQVHKVKPMDQFQLIGCTVVGVTHMLVCEWVLEHVAV